MSKASLALSISVAAHVAAIAIGLAYEPAEDPPDPVVRLPVAIELVGATPPAPRETILPIDVALISPAGLPAVPDDLVAAVAPVAPTAGRGVSTSRRGGDRGGVSTGAGPGQPGPGTGSARSPYMDLRKGKQDLRLDGGFASFDPSAGPGPERVIRGGQIQQDGGTHRSEQGVFTARVEKDGNVSLRDAKNLNIRLALPRPKMIGTAVSQWYASDKGEDGQRGKRTLEKEVGGSIDEGDRSRAAVVPVFRGGFDVTDALMRKFGAGDPYASKKLEFLDATRDERAQMGAKHRAGQLAQTDRIVRKHLEEMWRVVTDPAARKQGLFEMWDDAAESGDPELVEAGAAARRQIVGFIRARVPAGTAHAFSAAELAAMNAKKQSKQRFAPYE